MSCAFLPGLRDHRCREKHRNLGHMTRCDKARLLPGGHGYRLSPCAWRIRKITWQLASGTTLDSASAIGRNLCGLKIPIRQYLALAEVCSSWRAFDGTGSGYRVSESLPKLIPFNQQVHQVLSDVHPAPARSIDQQACGRRTTLYLTKLRSCFVDECSERRVILSCAVEVHRIHELFCELNST